MFPEGSAGKAWLRPTAGYVAIWFCFSGNELLWSNTSFGEREANISRQLFKHDLLFASDKHGPEGKSLGWGGSRKTWVFVLELPHISQLGQIL